MGRRLKTYDYLMLLKNSEGKRHGFRIIPFNRATIELLETRVVRYIGDADYLINPELDANIGEGRRYRLIDFLSESTIEEK
ncbi:MAG: hypothetical protein US53_C0013G0001 [Candidatus Woesebacteria bacterium GW2011_GWA1_37_7]|uniref:Uncharacterized protein n=1 Tax=Candidatus Woesebacteria bacterium GW2011_GWA1_37_7 TaxID=1618545 RepID=A0A0G0H699_9BACT|nr:MAG: hypothetical protein US53_C0013G0001 [Candidatus Woesebacteria bacterium GW2011_GWA1_37_7]